ncbi:MAG TPA: hypothetical protein QGH10_25185, partial [Armatimonadota bacterium]|nr:hypothetical protein [Armatimonadota bacterium]
DMTTLSAAVAMESAIYDHVNIGTGWQLAFRSADTSRSHLRLPPDYSYLPMYRMARAMTPDKPISMFLDIQKPPEFFAALPADQQGRALEWLAAEAYASQCYYAFHHRFSAFEGPRDEMARVASFFSDHHDRYYTGTRPEARVGVIYSYASCVWDMYPLKWSRPGPAHSMEYYGVCQALLDANMQFDTVFMGDGGVYADEQPEALDDFDAVIVPSAYALTDRNLSALAEYVANGGNLVVSGPIGTADEENQPRGVLPPELASGHPGIHRLRGDYEEYLASQNPMPLVDLADLLVTRMNVEPTVSLRDLDANLQLTVRGHDEGDRLLIDVINRDFKLGKGFTPSGETKLLLTLPADYGLKDKSIRAISPDSDTSEGELTWAPTRISRRQPVIEGMPGPMTIGSRMAVRINLPPVDVYTLVVIE